MSISFSKGGSDGSDNSLYVEIIKTLLEEIKKEAEKDVYYGPTAPNNPKDGDVWFSTDPVDEHLYVYHA